MAKPLLLKGGEGQWNKCLVVHLLDEEHGVLVCMGPCVCVCACVRACVCARGPH